jgi:hypothetical protein
MVMKTALCLALLGLVLTGCATTADSTAVIRPGFALSTSIEVVGTPGSPFIARYVHQGQNVNLTNALPFTLENTKLSEFTIRKVNLQETFTLHARQGGIEMSSTAGPGIPGIRVLATNGLEVQTLRD